MILTKLAGKTIEDADAERDRLVLYFTDGTVFDYALVAPSARLIRYENGEPVETLTLKD